MSFYAPASGKTEVVRQSSPRTHNIVLAADMCFQMQWSNPDYRPKEVFYTSTMDAPA